MRRANTHPSQLTVDEEFYPKFQFNLNPKRNSVEFGSGEVFRFLHLPITPVSSAWPSDTRCCTCIFQQWVKTRIHQSRNACIMCRIGHRFDARGTRRKEQRKWILREPRSTRRLRSHVSKSVDPCSDSLPRRLDLHPNCLQTPRYSFALIMLMCAARAICLKYRNSPGPPFTYRASASTFSVFYTSGMNQVATTRHPDY